MRIFLHADCVDDHFDVLDHWNYENLYGGGFFDVGGSFKGFDCIEEPVGYDDGSLPVKIKDKFENEVILDDVVSSPSNFSMLLKRKGKSRVKFTRMKGIIKRSKMVSLRMQGGSYQVSMAKQVVNHVEYANSIHLAKDKLSLQVILGTNDETSSKDDTSSNDEISSSEDLINYLSAHDVEWKLPKNTQEEPPKLHFDPIKTKVEEPLRLDIVYPHSHVASSVMGTNRTGKAHYGLRSLGPLKEKMVHVKKPNMIGQLTVLVAEMEAFDDPGEVFDTLMGLSDEIQVEEAKLARLNDLITQAEEEIEMKEA
uniref:Uncharacterized protein n=1 Tax=Tanacetum cinerariifolium TaxID=118510 RepID=A0A699GRS0_TANCI|nr:hypothetical protein [Tanacetum cinerariifolium]